MSDGSEVRRLRSPTAQKSDGSEVRRLRSPTCSTFPTFQVRCHSYVKRAPHWLSAILIILSNDINLNPEPHFQNNFFNFISWNVNSLAKDNFQRIRLIEAHTITPYLIMT